MTWSVPGCPVPPASAIDWPEVEAALPWLRELAACPQDPIHHREGDVLTHTRLVCDALVASPGWRQLPATDRMVVFAAALLHDVGKATRTVVADDGRVSSRGHAVTGARRSRGLIYRGDWPGGPAPFVVREAVVALVRHHGLPLAFLDAPDPVRAVVTASQTARCDRLALLAIADARGRRSADREGLLERADLFREFAGELACLDRPRAFASDRARFRYLATGRGTPDDDPHDGTWGEVVVMSGLPAGGKSEWLRGHLPHLPVVSLDSIRAEIGVRPDEDQGAVVARARELARIYLRAHRPFAWDATNVTRPLRARLVDLIAGYGARVRIVYVEAPYPALLARNRMRPQPVPERVVERLIERLDVPDPTESHALDHVMT